MTIRFWISSVVGFGAILASSMTFAAPAAKPIEEKLTPPTAEQFQTSENNLKQIAIGFHAYHDTYNVFPTNVLTKEKKPNLSWRVQILPFIEEEALYKEFRLDEPWDSDHNKKLVDKMPKLFQPIRVKRDKGLTYYQSFSGSNGVLTPGRTLFGITDGTSNTLLVAESAKPVIWTKPEDLEYDGKKVPALGGMFDGRFHAAIADGSVRRFRHGANEKTLGLLIDPADGNPVDIDDVLDDPEEKK